MFSRPNNFSRPVTVSANGNSTVSDKNWSREQVSSFLNGIVSNLPEGKSRQFFQQVQRELNSGFSSNRGYEVILQPISSKNYNTPIIIDKLSLPDISLSEPAVFSNRDQSRSFEIPIQIQDKFLIFPDADSKNQVLTYQEAYTRLGLSSIGALKVTFS